MSSPAADPEMYQRTSDPSAKHYLPSSTCTITSAVKLKIFVQQNYMPLTSEYSLYINCKSVAKYKIIATSLAVFKNRLKTYLFRRCYETV